MNPYLIGLVGDSDIARWPIALRPNISTNISSDRTTTHHDADNSTTSVLVSGHAGITLQEILCHVKDTITKLLQYDSSDATTNHRFVVVCGGENDIGCGVPLNTSKLAFQALLDHFHSTNLELSKRQYDATFVPPPVVHCIFLGPKLEPWLSNDAAARKSYIQMSTTFEQLCHQQRKKDVSDGVNVEYIHYVDCLTMFCECSANDQPGALYGGKAVPATIYFHSDQLHISDAAYAIWKSKVEDKISAICSKTRPT